MYENVRIYILPYGGMYGPKYVLSTDVNIWSYSPSRVLVEYNYLNNCQK